LAFLGFFKARKKTVGAPHGFKAEGADYGGDQNIRGSHRKGVGGGWGGGGLREREQWGGSMVTLTWEAMCTWKTCGTGKTLEINVGGGGEINLTPK